MCCKWHIAHNTFLPIFFIISSFCRFILFFLLNILNIDVIAADHMFSDLLRPIINTEMRQITVNRKGVYFAFYDTGACVTLLSIAIYYIMCEKVIEKFAIFPNTTTSIDKGDVKQLQVDGVCVNHATIELPPRNLCKTLGEWDFLTGGCKCMPGYQPRPKDNSCDECPCATYKWNTANDDCRHDVRPTASPSIKTRVVKCTYTCKQGVLPSTGQWSRYGLY